mmetsp:Transcript_37192/g.69390  ORF Transcript_37192/g.69390 Transcript_37192/m.69390 type:complete len:314 (+) Transcript_37192:338-1279(+)
MRTELQKLLVASLPIDTIKLGHRLVDITEKEDEVLLAFDNGFRTTAHVVVASDGIHSFVRQQIFSKDKPEYTGFRVLYSVSSRPIRPDPTKARMHWAEVDGRGYAILDVTAGHGKGRHDICAMILESAEEQVTDRWDSTMAKDRFADLAGRVAPSHSVLASAVEAADVCFDWGVYKQPKRRTWISPKGRVLLLGDAAHATAPFMAQGANMAMHDGWCLGRLLLNEKVSPSEAARLYETSRKAPCESIVEKSSLMGRMHTATGLWAVGRNNLFIYLLLHNLRAALSIDPTANDPSEETEGLLAKLGRRVRSICL